MSVCLSVCLFVCSVCLSVFLSVCLCAVSVWLSVCLSVCPRVFICVRVCVEMCSITSPVVGLMTQTRKLRPILRFVLYTRNTTYMLCICCVCTIFKVEVSKTRTCYAWGLRTPSQPITNLPPGLHSTEIQYISIFKFKAM